MPSITNKRLHTRDFMSRVLSRAGQFAHVEKGEFDKILARPFRDKLRVDEDSHYLKEAVPDLILKLYRSGSIGRMFNAEGTIQLIEESCGRLCALCHAVSKGFVVCSPAFAFYICPTFLHCVGTEHSWALAPPICSACYDTVQRARGDCCSLFDESKFIASVAKLASNKKFVERASAHQIPLRFDPRWPMRVIP